MARRVSTLGYTYASSLMSVSEQRNSLWYGLHLGKEDLKAYALCLLILFAKPLGNSFVKQVKEINIIYTCQKFRKIN
jgi:hypothetical protein